ncbi:hypothetical protein DQ04_00361210 [Trypanosoma grayi]|uniref:hypothetical protein n=1 Tax=Trypanosoma grayi TaxID=71804 RepID=UPI0004F4017B|nr:hypothetical protein DQ04_00361210 [Trypanosoma grayi]KEG14659.1 hypothetical protein DQ04_00361210 [Trypanosoma grayi]
MREGDAIVSLGTVCISLYQCPPSVSGAGGRCCYGVARDYRGDVLVPFYRGSTAYAELAAGVEYRLNQYTVLHAEAAEKRQQQQQHLRHTRESACGNGCGCGFNGAYYCSRCGSGGEEADGGGVAAASSSETRRVAIDAYPRVVVRNFTRVRPRAHDDDTVVYDAVDDGEEVTENNLCCFFYYVMEKTTKGASPVVAKDGSTTRPLIGRDHVRAYASDSAYDDGEAQKHIELKVGERLLRIGTSAEQRFEDIFQRLKKRNIHVHRLFDGVTGASILPCELVRHLSWRVSALCADVVLPLSASVGVKRRRNGGEEEEEDTAGALAEDVGTLISLSDVPPCAYAGNTLSLQLGSSINDDVDTIEIAEAPSWRHEQLLLKTTFGFDEDDTTVPIEDLFSPAGRGVPPDGSAELVEGSSPLKPYYLDDDSYMSTVYDGAPEGSSVAASATPMRNDIDIAMGDSSRRGVRRRMARHGRGDRSPILVTQQSLPDFCLGSTDEEEEEEEEAEKEDDG